MTKKHKWLRAARPQTLTAAAAPVIISISAAHPTAPRTIAIALGALLFALTMQVAANFINDYYDWRQGDDDAATRLGPPRACTMGWVTPRAMLRAIALTLTLATALGLATTLTALSTIGWGALPTLLLVGAACLLAAILYTTTLSRIALGDLLVILFFGLVPVSTTYYLLTGTLTQPILLLAIACGLVIDTLLIVNNYRDLDVDRANNKRTLAVVLGRRPTLALYFLCGFIAAIVPLFTNIVPGHLSRLPLIVYLALHCKTYQQLCKLTGREINTILAQTARNNLIYAICIAIAMLTI